MRLTLPVPAEIAEERRDAIYQAACVLLAEIRESLPEDRQADAGYQATIALRYALAGSGATSEAAVAGVSYLLANICAGHGRAVAAEKGNRYQAVYAVQTFQDGLQLAAGALKGIFQHEQQADEMARLLGRSGI